MNLSLLMVVAFQFVHTCYNWMVDDNELLWILLSRFFRLKILFFFVATINSRQQKEKKRRKDVQRWWSDLRHTCSNRIINKSQKNSFIKQKCSFSHVCVLPITFYMHKTKIMFKWKKENAHTHYSPAWRWTRYYEIRYSLVSYYWWPKPTLSDTHKFQELVKATSSE